MTTHTTTTIDIVTLLADAITSDEHLPEKQAGNSTTWHITVSIRNGSINIVQLGQEKG